MIRRTCTVIAIGLVGTTTLIAGQTINVTDYGAVADDGRDDAAAINRAIEAGKPGDTVVLPKGRFLVGAAIKPMSKVALRGAGQKLTTLRHMGTAAHAIIEITKGTEDIEISDMTLDGAKSPMAVNGISAFRSKAVNLHDLTVRDLVDTKEFGPHGIALFHTPDSSICDNNIVNIGPKATWGCGIRVADDSTHCRILRNTIRNTGRGGIMTNGRATDAIIRRNIVTDTHGIGFGIEVHSGSVRTIIEDNIVDHGLSIVSGYCATRRNVVIDPTSTWGGYGIEGGGAPNGVVTDNLIDHGQKLGISVSRGKRASPAYSLWSHNTFRNCSMWGVQFQGGGEGGKVSCMYFYKNVFAGIKRGHPSATYPGHAGNAIRFNGYTENIVFDSNRIQDNGAKAIQITGAKGVGRISFIDNVITGNRMGLMDRYPDTPVIWRGNFVSGNGNGGPPPTTKGFAGEPPTVSFECPAEVTVGEPVKFRNTSTTPGSAVGHVLWDFGAGVPVADESPTYVYEQPGAYRVTLVVWNKDDWAGRPAVRIIRVRGE